MFGRRSGLDRATSCSWRGSVLCLVDVQGWTEVLPVVDAVAFLCLVGFQVWTELLPAADEVAFCVLARRSGLDRVTTCSWRGIVRPQTVWRSCPWAPQAWVLAYWRPFKITGLNSAKNKTHIPDIRFFGIYILWTYAFSPGATKSHLKFAIAHLYNRPHTSILYLSFYKLTVNVRPITPVDCLI